MESTHLDKRVDYTNIGTGIEDLVESRLSVDQLQLVKLLVILEHKGFVTCLADDDAVGDLAPVLYSPPAS